jgi:hypothetical protein
MAIFYSEINRSTFSDLISKTSGGTNSSYAIESVVTVSRTETFLQASTV